MRKLILIALLFAYNAHAAETVKIGVTIPLSGGLAHNGVDIQRGIDLAISELPGEPVKIEAIYEDNQHVAKLAAAAAQKLIDRDKVDILVSIWDMADVVAPLADRAKIPHLSIRWNPYVAHNHKYSLTFESTFISFVKSQIELLKSQGIKTVAMATEESIGWRYSADEFKKQAPAAGLQIVSEQSFLADNMDFLTIVARLMKSKPDVVVLNAHQPQIDVIIKKIQANHPNQFMTGWFETVKPLSLIEGLPFASQYEAAPWFREKFKKKYGEDFIARAPYGYDLIMLLSEIYSKTGGRASADQIVSTLSDLTNYKGAAGTYTSNGKKNIETECVWQIVRNGKIVPLDSSEH